MMKLEIFDQREQKRESQWGLFLFVYVHVFIELKHSKQDYRLLSLSEAQELS